MTILHHGFQIPDHDAIYSRMNLISTVPLSVNSKDKLLTPIQNLDQTMESVSNVLSKHTKNIDSWLSTQDKYKTKRKKQEVLLPFDRGPPAGYQDDLFISLSPAIEKSENIIKEDDKIKLNLDNENTLTKSIQSTENLNDSNIITRDIDQILPNEEQIEIIEPIDQNTKKESEIEDEFISYDESKNSSEYYKEEEEEEEGNEEKQNDKPKTQRSLRESAKTSRVNTEEIEATHRFKSLLKTRNMSPEPCTYDPNFASIFPTINVPQLPPREKNDPYSPPKKPKQIELMSSTEVLGMYNSNLREFNPTNVHIRNFENLYIHYPNETKNVYDYIFKPKPKVDPTQPTPQLSESESMSSINTKEAHNQNTKSKSKQNVHNLPTSRLQNSKTPNKNETQQQYKGTNLINMEKNDNYILRPTSTMSSKVARDEVYRNYSGAKNLGPGQYNLPNQRPPVVIDMSNLHERDCLPTKKGSPRIYPQAVEQADKLRPKKPFHKFSTDTSRENKVVKNRRVEMLEKFKKEKKDLINDICKKSSLISAKISSISSKNSSSNEFSDFEEDKKRKISISELAEDELNYSIKRRSKSSQKKRCPFDIQSTRPNLLPGEKNYGNEPEPVYQFDPIESFKKIQPEAKFVTIRSKPKPLSDEKFWKTTWYGT